MNVLSKQKRGRKKNTKSKFSIKGKHVSLAVCSTSDKTGYSQPINKQIVKLFTSCKEFGYHIKIGPDHSGCS